jgi:hypothetical protein
METREKDRKDYKKPQLSQIKLEVEEAVLTACKNTTATGSRAVGCKSGSQACRSVWVGS